jgi:muramoyltetrapeptide carboxypeptidase
LREIIKPRPLAAGDTIGVIAPASWPNKEKARKAADFFEGLGYKVQFGQSLDRVHGYLAGTDQERIDELHSMFADQNIKGIFCVCGGYGTARIAGQLDYELIRANPKVFWGYSDITFLHVSILQHAGLVTFHGPMLSSDLGADDVHPLTKETFTQVFRPTKLTHTEEIRPLTTYVEGKAKGQIVGGNLTLLVSTLGTPYEVDTKDKLLFLEEIEEEPYRIDRMLNQLKMAGKFEDAVGILLCDFHNCTPTTRKPSLSLEEVFRDHIVSAGKPTLSGFSIGHCSPNLAVPIGVEGVIDTYSRTFLIEEAGVMDNGGVEHGSK